MSASTGTRDKSTTLAFRTRLSRRRALEAIHIEKRDRDPDRYADLSDCLREALDEYIDRHFAETRDRAAEAVG